MMSKFFILGGGGELERCCKVLPEIVVLFTYGLVVVPFR